MVKADELIKEQKEKEEKKKEIYSKIYDRVEKKIIQANTGKFYYTTYEIPELLIGMPLYSVKECAYYLQERLKKDGFETDFYFPNTLVIKWFPQEKK